MSSSDAKAVRSTWSSRSTTSVQHMVATSNSPTVAVGGARAVALRCLPETSLMRHGPWRLTVHLGRRYRSETSLGHGAQTSSWLYPRSVRRTENEMPNKRSADHG